MHILWRLYSVCPSSSLYQRMTHFMASPTQACPTICFTHIFANHLCMMLSVLFSLCMWVHSGPPSWLDLYWFSPLQVMRVSMPTRPATWNQWDPLSWYPAWKICFLRDQRFLKSILLALGSVKRRGSQAGRLSAGTGCTERIWRICRIFLSKLWLELAWPVEILLSICSCMKYHWQRKEVEKMADVTAAQYHVEWGLRNLSCFAGFLTGLQRIQWCSAPCLMPLCTLGIHILFYNLLTVGVTLRNVGSKAPQDCVVEMLESSIDLQMICSHCHSLDAQTNSICFKEFAKSQNSFYIIERIRTTYNITNLSTNMVVTLVDANLVNVIRLINLL